MTPQTVLNDGITDLLQAIPKQFRPQRSTLLYGGLLINTELAALFLFLVTSDTEINSAFAVVYPFIWINLGLWAVVRTHPTPQTRRHHYLASSVSIGYFLLLIVLGGLVWTAEPQLPLGIDIEMLSPGIGPVVSYNGPVLRFTLIPFLTIGYLSLAYLIYATLVDVAGSALGSVIGLFSCPSCVWPLIAPVFIGVFGSAGTTTIASFQSHVTGTAIFVVSIVVLYWRPLARSR